MRLYHMMSCFEKIKNNYNYKKSNVSCSITIVLNIGQIIAAFQLFGIWFVFHIFFSSICILVTGCLSLILSSPGALLFLRF